MRIQTQYNDDGEMLMVLPKNATYAEIEQLKRNLKSKREYKSVLGNLVIVVGD